MKTFTLDEAQSLLPVLEALLKRAIEGKQAAEEVESGLSEMARRIYISGGMRVDVTKVAKLRAEMRPAGFPLPHGRPGGSALLAHGRDRHRVLAHRGSRLSGPPAFG